MNDKNGGQGSAASSVDAWGTDSDATTTLTSAQRQQQTVTELARKKLLEVYKNQNVDYKEPTEDAPVPQATSHDWRKYHSAWQDYYQKYYGEYYGNAAREYVAREKMKFERERLERERKGETTVITSAPTSKYTDTVASQKVQDNFREKIREKAEKRAKKVKKSRHFVPLIIGGTILVIGLLFQYNQVIVSHVVAYMSPGNSDVNEIVAIDPTLSIETHKKPYLMIPKLNIEVPVVFGAKNDVNSMNIAMGNGVANFSIPGASAKPGEVGNFVISGHSAGNIYQQSDYKFIFSGLTRMKAGDMVYMDYKNVRYTYKITGTKTVNPTDVAALRKVAQDNTGKPMITLITCVPLGTSRQRLLVYGEQIAPNYDESSITPEPGTETIIDDGKTEMPANHDSPLEEFWKWLTGQN